MVDGKPRSAKSEVSRRRFVAGTAAVAGAAALPGYAFGQTALDQLLAAPSRGGWNDQFDMRQSTDRNVASHQPVFSQNTVMSMQQAIKGYTQIVMAGGWPMMPDQAVLQLGVQHPAVPVLRERLAIAGDLTRSAVNGSPTFDTYVDAGVKRF